MKIAFLALAVLAAQPEPAAQACQTEGSAEAGVLAEIELGVDPAFEQAIARATHPETRELANAGSDCEREARRMTLGGENGDPLPRVMRNFAIDQIGYLYPATYTRSDVSKTYYILVNWWSSGAVRVVAVFDGIPDDEALGSMRPPLGGGYEPLRFDPDTGSLIDPNNALQRDIRVGAWRYYQGLEDAGRIAANPLGDQPPR